VDIAVEDGDKDILISTTGFNRQLTGRSTVVESPREKVRMKGGQSREVGSREFHRNGRDGVASARAGWWKGGVLVERRLLRTRSRWPRAMMDRDWGGLRSLVVRPRQMALRRVVLEGEPRERET
jgi:hypothetical protein